jgi:hypothetical protein
MPRPKREWREDQLFCARHGEWHHHVRFNRRKRYDDHENPNEYVWEYDRDCKLYLQTCRVEKKNEDQARAIVERRASEVVREANRVSGPKITLAFVMGALNYRSLIPLVRAYLLWPEECFCPNCASTYNQLSTFHFDHREPPRHPRDWARLHARNIGPLDRECNCAKGDMPYPEWLDLEEDKRLSAEAHNARLADEAEQIAPTPSTTAGCIAQPLFVFGEAS